jgi:F-type H+-transporting ATPase subunit epsilon
MAGHVQCIVVTPERAIMDQQVDFVVLPMFDGELGVLPGRAALIGRLGYGELRTTRGGQTERYYVDGGFAQVRGDVVTVLTPRALKATELTSSAAERALEAALTAGKTPEAQERQLRAQARARAQLRLARRLERDRENAPLQAPPIHLQRQDLGN